MPVQHSSDAVNLEGNGDGHNGPGHQDPLGKVDPCIQSPLKAPRTIAKPTIVLHAGRYDCPGS